MKKIKNILKGTACVVLSISLVFALASCSSVSNASVGELPLVYAQDGTLKYLPADSKDAVKVTESFTPSIGSTDRAQLSADGKTLYYVEAISAGAQIGTLYKLNISKNGAKPEKLHENVYSFCVSKNDSCIVVMEGSGKLIKYDKRSEKKNEYKPIEESLVTGIIAVSSDGKYVIYNKVLPENTGVYSLCMARTDFTRGEKDKPMSKKQILENTDIGKNPVVISESSAEIIYASEELDTVYYKSVNHSKGAFTYTLGVSLNHKSGKVISKDASAVYCVDGKGNLLYAQAKKGAYSVSDVVVDDKAKSDSKLKKTARKSYSSEAAYKKAQSDYRAKVKRDEMRKKIQNYLNNFTTTSIYSFGVKSKEPKKVCEFTGQVFNAGNDEQEGIAFFNVAQYKFKDKKQQKKLEDITVAYSIFDEIRTQSVAMVSADSVTYFTPEKGASYNGGEIFVDAQNNRISAIFDYDFVKTLTGKLYTASYSKNAFENVSSTDKVSSLLGVSSESGAYYKKSDGIVRLGDKKIELGSGAVASQDAAIPVALCEEKNGKYTLYSLSGEKAVKLGTAVDKFDTKGTDYVFYSEYDNIKRIGNAKFNRGGEVIDLGENISFVMSYDG